MIIWKYELPVDDDFELTMPEGSQLLSIQIQLGTNNPCLWVLIDPNLPMVKRKFRTYRTGHSMPDGVHIKKYIGTYQVRYGETLVFHVFER